MSTLVLGSHSFEEIPDVNGIPVLLNAGGVPSIQRGILTARPAPGVAGRLFVELTNNQLNYDTGTSWIMIGGIPVNPILPGTGSVTVPVGTTAERPLTPTLGMLRYNTTLTAIESFSNNAWQQYVGIIAKSTVPLIVTTTAEIDLLNVTIPGGMLSTDGIIRIRIMGTFLNNSGATRTIIFRVRYGAAIVYQDVTAALPTTTANTGFSVDLYLASNNAVGAQTVTGAIAVGATAGATIGLNGDLGTDEIIGHAVIAATTAQNSAVDQILRVTTTASAGALETTRYWFVLEKV